MFDRVTRPVAYGENEPELVNVTEAAEKVRGIRI